MRSWVTNHLRKRTKTENNEEEEASKSTGYLFFLSLIVSYCMFFSNASKVISEVFLEVPLYFTGSGPRLPIATALNRLWVKLSETLRLKTVLCSISSFENTKRGVERTPF